MIPLLLLAILSGPKVEVKVTPAVCQSPCSVRLLVTVDRHEDNRWLVVQVEGPEIFYSGKLQLDGEAAKRIHEVFYHKLPTGDYEVIVVLYNTMKEISRARATFKVSGFGSGDGTAEAVR